MKDETIKFKRGIKINERKTENLVRNHFNRYLSEVTIEEQNSENPKIDKLLKIASKKGFGKRYPEFIIGFKDNRDLIVVIECKADIKKHESKNRDKYSEWRTQFWIDGKLYKRITIFSNNLKMKPQKSITKRKTHANNRFNQSKRWGR
jgi:hypothetical protein